ncbi:unnamed protein product, partial [Symbiodinium sp. CCMP2456]
VPTVPDDELKMPDWIFAKHQPAIIDRLKAEIGGAAFASKILKGSRRPIEEGTSEAVVDVSELLQPKKKSKKASSSKAKAKASGKRNAVSDTKENAEELTADVNEVEGCTRKRWWLDDLLTALINAAGLLIITTTATMFMVPIIES